ncbi:hypothetical protein LCGC14_0859990 [marine sediment metagenome]|uniref:Uncharacterized protein n=1 Tax=marine sediment metagenome TaxID=412755 RepID=A0A0F9P7N0_9ZZZZ
MEKEEFLKLLPKLIQEDNQVKGAIITALSGVVATKDDIKQVIEEFDKRFEAMDKRFEAMDKRFEVMDKRFDSMDKRFEAMQTQVNKQFERVHERLDNIDLGYGIIAEGIEYSLIKREFKQKGLDLKIQIRQHFHDENNYVHPDTKDIEIDIFHIKPNILGEATLKLTDLDKVRIFIRKCEFLKKMYKESFQKYLFCFHVDERIKQELDILLNQFNIELIVPTLD